MGRSAGGKSTVREINRDACHFPGFPVLQTLLPKHTNVPELYFLLMALFLQQPVTELPESLQVHVSMQPFSLLISLTVCPRNCVCVCCVPLFICFNSSVSQFLSIYNTACFEIKVEWE